jgi:hypothetical protein
MLADRAERKRQKNRLVVTASQFFLPRHIRYFSIRDVSLIFQTIASCSPMTRANLFIQPERQAYDNWPYGRFIRPTFCYTEEKELDSYFELQTGYL